MSPLHRAVEGWNPEPVSFTGHIDPWPAEAFAHALDIPMDLARGDALPALWHWFYLLEHPRRSELGEDGHPASGRFLPPIPDRRRMFAGSRVRRHAPLRVGDEVTRTSALERVRVKEGRSGEMVFVTVRSEFTCGGRLLLVEDQDIVYRSQPPVRDSAPSASPAAPLSVPASSASPAPGEPGGRTVADPAPGGTRVALETDPTLLFRMSALTYNTHRIHYDLPYCVDVEGYPGLVVHGPLLALLLLEIPRRSYPDRWVESFAFRLLRPAFAGQTIVADGHLGEGGELSLSGSVEGAEPSISGVAALNNA